MSQRTSLTRYLVEKQRVDGRILGDLRLLLEVVACACKSISHAVNKGALGGVLGSADTEKGRGEVQKKLDIIASDVLIEANAMTRGGVFIYPCDRREPNKPGKLRRMYQAIPIAPA